MQRSLGRIQYGLHFIFPSLALYLNHSILGIGCTAVGNGSKTIEIKNKKTLEVYVYYGSLSSRIHLNTVAAKIVRYYYQPMRGDEVWRGCW